MSNGIRESRVRRDDELGDVDVLVVPVIAGLFLAALVLVVFLDWVYDGTFDALTVVAGLLIVVTLLFALVAAGVMLHRTRRVQREERGSQTLQLAVIVPGILVLVFTIFQASMYYWAKSVATAAARQAATAAAGEDATAGDGRDRAYEFLDGTRGDVLQGAEVTVDRGATMVTVTVEGSAIGPIPGGWHVSQTAEVPVEEFTTDEDVN